LELSEVLQSIKLITLYENDIAKTFTLFKRKREDFAGDIASSR